MHTKYLSAALVSSALMIAPAVAQNTSGTTSAQSTSGTTSSSKQPINASSTGEWQASELIHMNVYNNQNEKVGTIQELMMDKSGKIDKAVIGVGGFLGIGTRDVAVNFSDLKFSDQPVPAKTAAGGGMAKSTSGAGSPTSANAPAKAKKNYPDHAVVAMNKDQLQALPPFNYSK